MDEGALTDLVVKLAYTVARFSAEWVGKRREATAFRVRQAQPAATELRFADTVFLQERCDDLLLVPLEPSSNHDNQDVQDHGVPRGENRAVSVRSSILPT